MGAPVPGLCGLAGQATLLTENGGPLPVEIYCDWLGWGELVLFCMASLTRNMNGGVRRGNIRANAHNMRNNNNITNFTTQFCNIRGIASNLTSVHHHLQSVGPHILFLTETQIDTPLSDVHLNCPGYRLHHLFHRRAGVCAFIRSDVPATRLDLFSDSAEHQAFWLKVCHKDFTQLIACVYRSPSHPDVSPLIEFLESSMETLLQQYPSAEFLVLGDFNVHSVDWLSSSSTDTAGIDTEAFAITNGLAQLVAHPTRVPDRAGDASNILDLFLTSSAHSYSPILVSAPLGSSDHCLISARRPFDSPPAHKPDKRILWKFSSADWDGLRSFYASLPWNDICFRSDNVDYAVSSVSELILEGMNLYIPHQASAGIKGSPKWFSSNCDVAIQSKNSAFRA